MEIRGGDYEVRGVDLLEGGGKRLLLVQKGDDGWRRQFSIEIPKGVGLGAVVTVVGFGACKMTLLDE